MGVKKIKPSNSEPINQKRETIRLLRADHYTDDAFFLELLISILENKEKMGIDNIEDIDLEVYDDGDPHKKNLIDYISDKTSVDKNDLKALLALE